MPSYCPQILETPDLPCGPKKLKWDDLIVGKKYYINGYKTVLEYVKEDYHHGYFIQYGSKFFVEDKNGVVSFIKYTDTRFKEAIEQGESKTISPANARKIIFASLGHSELYALLWGASIVLNRDIAICPDNYKDLRTKLNPICKDLLDEIFGTGYPFKKDERLIVWDNGTRPDFRIRKFSHMKNGKYQCYAFSDKENGTTSWDNAVSIKDINLPD